MTCKPNEFLMFTNFYRTLTFPILRNLMYSVKHIHNLLSCSQFLKNKKKLLFKNPFTMSFNFTINSLWTFTLFFNTVKTCSLLFILIKNNDETDYWAIAYCFDDT